ncbi:hypothetical protein H1R20_g16626, partial [Candolleomyces eurysporus]
MNTRQPDLKEHRTALQADPDVVYAASQGFHNLVEWFKTQNCDVLSRMDDVLEYEEKHRAHAQNPEVLDKNGFFLTPDKLANDFQVAYNHIVDSMRACPSGEGTTALRPAGVIDPKKPEGFGIKVSHRVFVKKEDDDDDYDENIIETWPVGPQAAPELERIKRTHNAVPIPAYNIAGQAIPPAQYATELQGATVSLTFHLKHWVIQNKHTFTADIESEEG